MRKSLWRKRQIEENIPMAKMSFVNAAALEKILKIKSLLSTKEMTISQLSEQIFTCYRSTSAYIKYLKDNNLVYISSYKVLKLNKYNRNVAFYKFGKKRDAAKPPPKTAAEKAKALRKKIFDDPELYSIYTAKRRLKNIKPKSDWSSNWIPR